MCIFCVSGFSVSTVLWRLITWWFGEELIPVSVSTDGLISCDLLVIHLLMFGSCPVWGSESQTPLAISVQVCRHVLLGFWKCCFLS